jgi:phage portal protein BeeE
VGKAKRRKQGARATDPGAIAQRHEFSYGGMLGHDPSASWVINVSEQTALGLDVVQECVQIIADAVAGADVGQWNGTTRIDPPSGFTLRPDVDMTRHDFLWLFAANLALYRAAYLEEASVGGQVVGGRLHCIATVTRVGSDLYVGGQRISNRMKLVRQSVWPTLDPDTGSTLSLAREVFAGAMAANAYASDFWQSGGAPVVYIKTDQELIGDQADNLRTEYVTKRTENPGSPAVFGKGGDLKAFGADLGTEGANSGADKLRASIARYFKMPPSAVNVLSEAGPLTYVTEEQEGIKLVKYTIQPYCDVIGEALSAYLPGDYLLGDRIVIDPMKLTRASQLTRYQAWESALRARWLTKEEVRAQEGYSPDDSLEKPAPVAQGVANVGA